MTTSLGEEENEECMAVKPRDTAAITSEFYDIFLFFFAFFCLFFCASENTIGWPGMSTTTGRMQGTGI